MRGKIVLTACSVILPIVMRHVASEELAPREIVDRAIETTRLAGAEARATMIIIDSKGRERVREIAQVTKLYDDGETEKKLVRFLAPADVKGTGLLTFDSMSTDDDMWLYMPALRKTRRIISSEKAKSFMGSEFSYADMTPPSLDEFTFELLGEEIVDGLECWKIAMVPLDDDIADENGFSKRVSFYRKDCFVIRRSIYYDLDGELHKELNVLEIKELDPLNHKYRPLHLVMVNMQNERQSIFKIEAIEFNPDVRDDYFTTRYLERE